MDAATLSGEVGRPKLGQPWPQLPSSFFTLEDPALVKAAEATLSSFAILSAVEPELPVLYSSSHCCELLSSQGASVVGTGLPQALQLSPASLEQLMAALEQSFPVCLRLERATGPVEAAFVPVASAGCGLPLYWIAYFGELAATAQVPAEAPAPDSEAAGLEGQEGQQAASPAFDPAVFVLGPADGCPEARPILEAVNERFVELTGHTAADLGSAGHHGLYGTDTAEETALKLDAALAGHQHGTYSLLLYHKDGSCRWCYVCVCPLPSGCACLVVDVTAASLRRIGSYCMGRVIGQGTYGTVRIGRDQATGDLVALKLVDTRTLKHLDELQQLQDEMAALAALRHPRIIRLFGTQQVADQICFIMEYAHGGSLKAFMDAQENRVLSEERAKHFFEQMVSAVDYCHRRRVVHRDIKPENLLLDEKGDIKIADFGLAGITTPFDDTLSETCGTMEFTAPEVLSRQEYSGLAADMWSLGAVVYEMLAGKSPFKRPTPAAIVKAALSGVYEPLPDSVSPQCRNLLAGLLTVNPELRMSMEQVVCHPWLLSDVPPAAEDVAVPGGSQCAAGQGNEGDDCQCAMGELSEGDPAPSGISTRHNSLRLVVPGMEELQTVPEEGEASSCATATAPPARTGSIRRSLSNPQQQLGTASSPKTGSRDVASPLGPRDAVRRSRSQATGPTGGGKPSGHVLRPSRSSGAAAEAYGVPHTVQLGFGGHDAHPSKAPSKSQRAAAC